ncbi:hypothetical protein FQN49_007428 [Arthroderma sp. PD_2]|nr:hypothetical protein FQN49_007428 [Arthroderma sp. PD_2]
MSDENVYNYTSKLSEALVILFPSTFIFSALKSETFADNIPGMNHTPESPRHLLPAAASTSLEPRFTLRYSMGMLILLSYFSKAVQTLTWIPDTQNFSDFTINTTGLTPTSIGTGSIHTCPITPLQFACLADRWEIIKILLLYDVPLCGMHYHLAILSAIEGRHLSIVNYLLNIGDLGSMPDDLERFWYLALRVACDHGAVKAVQMIVDRGVYVAPERFSCLECSLSLAATHGFDQIITLLLKRGADPNLMTRQWVTKKGTSAIAKASKFGHIKSLQIMLDACVPDRPVSIISSAAGGGQEHVVRYLVEKGILLTLREEKHMAQIVKVAVERSSRIGYPWMKPVYIDIGLLKPQ